MSTPVADDGTTNITVCVRIRPQNDLEKRGKHPNVISSISDTEVKVVQTTTSTQQRSTEKISTFDHVFDSTSTQEQVFNIAAEPVVRQVLDLGIDGSILAYGMTSSGKTYTMGSSNFGAPNDPTIGIIPRCVNLVFERLQEQGCEFSVKVSFLELYNEDLIDLLTDDPAANTAAKQLRIYDDPKLGTQVQNLDEMIVTNPQDAFALLQKANQRRHVTGTNLNAQSSRSHTIFTITIHIKDVQENEEFYRTGKLHLVDLAGSENTKNSGATGQTQKEAGKINVSLLSLGRCITALVQKQVSVPFRESKLTRILKDSLTRSKTCIIANVSPSQLCVDESANTIDYAYRAKSIKNKLQANERVTQRHYFKSLLSTLNRLKAENSALRSKNGIYLPPEHYHELTEGYDVLKNELGEAKEELEKVNFDLADQIVQTTAQQDITSLIARQHNLNSQQLLRTRNQLAEAKEMLFRAQKGLNEESFYTTQLEKTENILQNQASVLISTVSSMSSDNTRLFEKIERHSSQEEKNLALVEAFKGQSLDYFDQILGQIEDSNTSASTSHLSLTSLTANHCNTVNQVVQESGDVMGAWGDEVEAVLGENLGQNQAFIAQSSLQTAQFHSSLVSSAQSHLQVTDAMRNRAVEGVGEVMGTVGEGVDGVNGILDQHLAHTLASTASNKAAVVNKYEDMMGMVGEFGKGMGGRGGEVDGILLDFGQNDQNDQNSQQNQLDLMMKHQQMFQKTTADQFKKIGDGVGKDSEEGRVRMDHFSLQFAQNHQNNLKTLDSLTNLTKSHASQMGARVEAVKKEVEGYGALFEGEKDKFQKNLNSSHSQTQSQISSHSASNDTWLEAYVGALGECREKERGDFEAVVRENEELKQKLEKFKKQTLEQLSSHSSQLLLSMTTLVQNFVTQQQCDIDAKLTEFEIGIEETGVKNKANFEQNLRNFDEKVHKKHLQKHQTDKDNLLLWSQAASVDFATATANLDQLNHHHLGHQARMEGDHLGPIGEEIGAQLGQKTAQIDQFHSNLTSSFNADATQLSTHIATTKANTEVMVKMVGGFDAVHKTANYPEMMKNLHNFSSNLTASHSTTAQTLAQLSAHNAQSQKVIVDFNSGLGVKMGRDRDEMIENLEKNQKNHSEFLTTTTTTIHNLHSSLSASSNQLIAQANDDYEEHRKFIVEGVVGTADEHLRSKNDAFSKQNLSFSTNHKTLTSLIENFKSAQELTNGSIVGYNDGFRSKLGAQVGGMVETTLKSNHDISSKIASLTSSIQLLTSQQLQKLVPTGETPVKKMWKYPGKMSQKVSRQNQIDSYRLQYAQISPQNDSQLLQVTQNGTIGEGNEDLVDDEIQVEFGQVERNLTKAIIEAQRPLQYNEAQQALPKDQIEVDFDEIVMTNRVIQDYEMLAQLPESNLEPYQHTTITAVNTDAADETDNAPKTITTVTLVDQNAKLAQLRARILGETRRIFVENDKTEAVLGFNPSHDAGLVDHRNIMAFSEPVMVVVEDGKREVEVVEDAQKNQSNFENNNPQNNFDQIDHGFEIESTPSDHDDTTQDTDDVVGGDGLEDGIEGLGQELQQESNTRHLDSKTQNLHSKMPFQEDHPEPPSQSQSQSLPTPRTISSATTNPPTNLDFNNSNTSGPTTLPSLLLQPLPKFQPLMKFDPINTNTSTNTRPSLIVPSMKTPTGTVTPTPTSTYAPTPTPTMRSQTQQPSQFNAASTSALKSSQTPTPSSGSNPLQSLSLLPSQHSHTTAPTPTPTATSTSISTSNVPVPTQSSRIGLGAGAGTRVSTIGAARSTSVAPTTSRFNRIGSTVDNVQTTTMAGTKKVMQTTGMGATGATAGASTMTSGRQIGTRPGGAVGTAVSKSVLPQPTTRR